MPVLFNQKHEFFARGIVAGKEPRQARSDSGATESVAVLSKDPMIRARIAELSEEKFKRDSERKENLIRQHHVEFPVKLEDVTPEFIVNQLLENGRMAREAGQYAASTKAYQVVADALGMFDKEEALRKKAEEEEQRKKESNPDLTLDVLNKVLSETGFTGTIDLTNLNEEQKKLPVLHKGVELLEEILEEERF